MNAAILKVAHLSKSYGGVRAVANVSFEVAPGARLAVIGPNGAGKTTCFNMLSGQLAPDAGRIEFEAHELAGLTPRRIWKLGVSRTFQIAATFGSMSVRQNVQTALLSHHRRLRSLISLATRAYTDEADALLERVGILDQAARACALLAYGDLKRVELAIALANRPRLLLMDEPTAGMGPRERSELMQLTSELARREGIAMLFTEHDMDVVFHHAERILVLNQGELIADGSPAEVRANSRVREVYLGSRFSDA
jgi:branched-chain amino acid transport system ATP-binding protein